jgi:hypothetical protein
MMDEHYARLSDSRNFWAGWLFYDWGKRAVGLRTPVPFPYETSDMYEVAPTE